MSKAYDDERAEIYKEKSVRLTLEHPLDLSADATGLLVCQLNTKSCRATARQPHFLPKLSNTVITPASHKGSILLSRY